MTWTFSPADVPKQIEDQFEFLLSLSQEEDYVHLVKQADCIPVRAHSLFY